MNEEKRLTEFEQFMRDRGFEFKTDEALRAAYDRLWKCRHDILISEDEFIAEANGDDSCRNYDVEVLKAVYGRLAKLVDEKKLAAHKVYGYARFRWCLHAPDAIIAYPTERDKWEVNDCATKISEDAAKVKINGEWGFEVSRMKIIGTPYYDATDWQFIRFNCAGTAWLWKSSSLYQVYE